MPGFHLGCKHLVSVVSKVKINTDAGLDTLNHKRDVAHYSSESSYDSAIMALYEPELSSQFRCDSDFGGSPFA